MRVASRALLCVAFIVFALYQVQAENLRFELEGLDGLDLPDRVHTSERVKETVAVEPQNSPQCQERCERQQQLATELPKPRAVTAEKARRRTSAITQPQRPRSYVLEAAALIVFFVYFVVAIWGTRVNKCIAQNFALAHCVGESAVFPRQFALCGAGEANSSGTRTPLVQEHTSLFKFYASGRRHCQGCLATLSLRNRPDLLSWVLGLFWPSEDLLEIDVYMNEANMPSMVLAIGTPRQARSLSERPDVASFAKPLKITESDPDVPNWPAHKLTVLAEHSTLFYDLFSDPRASALFTSPAHADKLRLFRSLLITSDNSGGSHKRLLRAVFALPAADDMRALGPLLALVPLLIDLVGIMKLSPEQKKRATDARAKVEALSAEAEENRRRRIEAVQKRKAEKAQEEKERIARLAPEARRKAEEKLAKQAAKKTIKLKMVRM